MANFLNRNSSFLNRFSFLCYHFYSLLRLMYPGTLISMVLLWDFHGGRFKFPNGLTWMPKRNFHWIRMGIFGILWDFNVSLYIGYYGISTVNSLGFQAAGGAGSSTRFLWKFDGGLFWKYHGNFMVFYAIIEGYLEAKLLIIWKDENAVQSSRKS